MTRRQKDTRNRRRMIARDNSPAWLAHEQVRQEAQITHYHRQVARQKRAKVGTWALALFDKLGA